MPSIQILLYFCGRKRSLNISFTPLYTGESGYKRDHLSKAVTPEKYKLHLWVKTFVHKCIGSDVFFCRRICGKVWVISRLKDLQCFIEVLLGPMKGLSESPSDQNEIHTFILMWNWLKCSNYTKSTLDIVIFKSTPETVKYLTSTLDTDPPLSRALLLLVSVV